jgi:hypothetical protein
MARVVPFQYMYSKPLPWIVLPLVLLLLSLVPSRGFLLSDPVFVPPPPPLSSKVPLLLVQSPRSTDDDSNYNPPATTTPTISNTSTTTPTATVTRYNWVTGPPTSSKPNYEAIHGPLGKTMDDFFLTMFRTQLARQVGMDSHRAPTDYQGLMDLVQAMNARYSYNRTELHLCAQRSLSTYDTILFYTI